MARGWTAETLRRKGFVIDDQLGRAAPTQPITLILPYPPSGWALYDSRHKLTPEARDYRRIAVQAACLQWQDCAPLKGSLRLVMALHQPRDKGLDFDNSIKAAADALTQARIWEDDSQVDDFHWKRIRQAEHPHIVLTIEELPR